MPLSPDERPLPSGWETLFEADSEWLGTQPWPVSSAQTSASRPGGTAANDRLVQQLQQWIAECRAELCTPPGDAERHDMEYPLAGKLWACWKHHWLAECKVTDGGKVDGMRVATRIRAGIGIDSRELGGDVIHDLVWADAVLRGDQRATVAFFQCFDDFAIAVARKTAPRYARQLDWWDNLKSTLVVREKRPGKLANYLGHASLKSWLGKTFVREILHQADRDRHAEAALEAFPNATATAAQSAIDRDCREKVLIALRDSLEAMEPGPRQAVLHHFVDGLENQQIARIMGVVPGTATRRRLRGLSQLREFLEDRIQNGGRALDDCLKHLLRLNDDLDLATLLRTAEQVPASVAANAVANAVTAAAASAATSNAYAAANAVANAAANPAANAKLENNAKSTGKRSTGGRP
jgi:RNA polymerase sigma factor (sigma-70 family)